MGEEGSGDVDASAATAAVARRHADASHVAADAITERYVLFGWLHVSCRAACGGRAVCRVAPRTLRCRAACRTPRAGKHLLGTRLR